MWYVFHVSSLFKRSTGTIYRMSLVKWSSGRPSTPYVQGVDNQPKEFLYKVWTV